MLFLFLIPQNSFSTITSAQARSVFLQSDGSVVAVGSLTDSVLGTQFAVVRYTILGALDPFFGSAGTGIVETSIGNRAEANSGAVDSNGQIIASGFVVDTDNITKAVTARYNMDGSIDSSFGTSGTGNVITQIGEGSQLASVVIQPDNNIVVAGSAVFSGQSQIIIMRYNTADGSLDSSFNNNGIVTASIGYHCGASSMALQNNGQIIVTGFATMDGIPEIMLARFNTDGSLDTSYGNSGFVTTSVGAPVQIYGLALDANGYALVAGTSQDSFILARYDTNGTLDQNFGNNGIVLTSIGFISEANSIAIQPDGNIVVAGFSDSMFALARYNIVGALDTSFGNNGIVTTVITHTDAIQSLALQNNGSIVVAGSASTDFAVARYLANGNLDISWGTNGVITVPGGARSLGTIITDQKPMGIQGGTFFAGDWMTRDLNTLEATSSNITLNSNQFTLAPGIYTLSAFAPAYMVDSHQIRLQNITMGTTQALGVSSFSSSTQAAATTLSMLEATLALSVPTTFEIQHQCATTGNNNGFGIATGFGTEIYTTVRILTR